LLPLLLKQEELDLAWTAFMEAQELSISDEGGQPECHQQREQAFQRVQQLLQRQGQQTQERIRRDQELDKELVQIQRRLEEQVGPLDNVGRINGGQLRENGGGGRESGVRGAKISQGEGAGASLCRQGGDDVPLSMVMGSYGALHRHRAHSRTTCFSCINCSCSSIALHLH
jgi:hypothetical protein